MKFFALSAALMVLGGCSGPPSEGAREEVGGPVSAVPTEDEEGPSLRFVLHPLVGGRPGVGVGADRVWSQNDDRDSLSVVASGLPTGLIQSVQVELVGRFGVEGDAVVDQSLLLPRSVRWRTITEVLPDSLPDEGGGKVLMTLHPSVLWEEYKSVVGQEMELDSLRVQVIFKNGQTLERGILLLWD